jgi:hypothetical protein
MMKNTKMSEIGKKYGVDFGEDSDLKLFAFLKKAGYPSLAKLLSARGVKPRRIQRKRTKGWRMPPNTVYVGRPSKWGNPFREGEEDFESPSKGPLTKEKAIDLYWDTIVNRDFSELKGKNLACYCKLSDMCHADILLEIAND